MAPHQCTTGGVLSRSPHNAQHCTSIVPQGGIWVTMVSCGMVTVIVVVFSAVRSSWYTISAPPIVTSDWSLFL